jgi:ABC-type nickel/cobalt efflux system permease component RcnA
LGSGALVAALALSQLPQRIVALQTATIDDAHAREHADALAAVGGRRALFVFGAAGGLLPCPSALVVLLVAVAAHRIAFGLALVAAFSLGLAAVLVALGIVSVLARTQLERFTDRRALAILPVLSALCVFALGVAICLDAYARR